MDVYRLPYNADYPVICMDESSKQLIGEVTPPIPASVGHVRLQDDEYVRNGVAEIFAEIEPLTGRCHVKVTETRKMVDWAEFIREMLEERYPDAAKVILVLDNLNTHAITSLYEAFPPEKARTLASRLEIHHTPKHGSWLNIAEIELSVLKRQCLDRRIPDIELMRGEVKAWVNERNGKNAKVNWQFSTTDARIKLKRLYPQF